MNIDINVWWFVPAEEPVPLCPLKVSAVPGCWLSGIH